MAIYEMDGCYFSPWMHKSAGWLSVTAARVGDTLKRRAGRDMHKKCSDFEVHLWLHLLGPYQFGTFFDIGPWL